MDEQMFFFTLLKLCSCCLLPRKNRNHWFWQKGFPYKKERNKNKLINLKNWNNYTKKQTKHDILRKIWDIFYLIKQNSSFKNRYIYFSKWYVWWCWLLCVNLWICDCLSIMTMFEFFSIIILPFFKDFAGHAIHIL